MAFMHGCVRVMIVDLFICSVFSLMVVALMLVTLTENTGRRSKAVEGGFLNRANARPDVCVVSLLNCILLVLCCITILVFRFG